MEGLNAEFSQRFQRLKAAVEAQGGTLSTFSGGRDRAKQAELYAAALKKYGSEKEARRWVAPPGKSNHDTEAGLKYGLGTGAVAADLSGSLDLAHKLAPQFGLSFPLSNENWHIEQAGIRDGGAQSTAYSAPAPESGWHFNLLKGLGATPTPEKIKALLAWRQAEGGTAAFNPLNTTQPYAQATKYNSVGVRNYGSAEDGMNATLKTLNNGRYNSIVNLFRNDKATAVEIANAVAASPWGTGQGVLRVLGSGGAEAMPASALPNTPYAPSQDTNVVSALAQRILASNNELINTPRTYGAPKFNIMSSMRGAV